MMMGYGALSGGGNTSTPNHVSASHPHVVQIRVLTEDSPLIARRRFRRQQRRHEDSICNWKILSLFFILIAGVYIGIHLLFLEYNGLTPNHAFHLIDRDFWQSTSNDIFNYTELDSSLVSFLVIMHTQTEKCLNYISCINVISRMENDSSVDLKYNFLIGSDGMTYEVRGWNLQSGFDISIAEKALTVGIIGNFTAAEPDQVQIAEVNAFIAESIRREKLRADYKILGARQKSNNNNNNTGLDGEKLFETIKRFFLRWEGFIV